VAQAHGDRGGSPLSRRSGPGERGQPRPRPGRAGLG
jgi:hypothetical protein